MAGFFTDGAEGDRTLNLLHAMQARSQLRHGPVCSKHLVFL